MELQFLAGREVLATRPLWEEVFNEDTKEFTDYYFKYKAMNNLTFTQMEGSEVISMVHLTPYATGKGEEVCYIVGVATKESYRRKGLMDELLKSAFACMQDEREPFTFLMPANKDIYEPYGFTYIYDKPCYELNTKRINEKLLDEASQAPDDAKAMFTLLVLDMGMLTVRTVRDKDCARVARFANEYLAKNYDCYMQRSEAYYKTMKQELKAQNGNLFMVEKDGIILGLLSYAKEAGKVSLQEVLFEKELDAWELLRETEKKPMIMARIIDVKQILSKLQSEKEFVLALKIIDERLIANDGLYMLHCGPLGGNITPIKIADAARTNEHGECCHAECEVTIENLTAFFFGYKKAEDCFKVYAKSKAEELYARLNALIKYDRVCINEIV
ncbi:MAG: GNAT family N-acetyltransferase [Lachnospiraceae bacterium]|nr:GNAT family N-acetyltransferase [Lachnospiraceae bacterium]